MQYTWDGYFHRARSEHYDHSEVYPYNEGYTAQLAKTKANNCRARAATVQQYLGVLVQNRNEAKRAGYKTTGDATLNECCSILAETDYLVLLPYLAI